MRLAKITSESLSEAVRVLKFCGVIAHPTDTCYGLAANIFEPLAVNRIIRIKKMSSNKPMSIAVHDVSELSKYGELSLLAEKIIKKYMPGAITILVPRTLHVPAFYYPESELIGLRVPKHKLTRDLAKGIGRPITTTSANISGKKENYSGQDVFDSFFNEEKMPDLVFNSDLLVKKRDKPSTIVKIIGETMEIVRQGGVVIEI